MANLDLNRSSLRAVSDALMHDKGSSQFVQECKSEFNDRMKLITREHDPSVSQHNLANLRACMADMSIKLDMKTR